MAANFSGIAAIRNQDRPSRRSKQKASTIKHFMLLWLSYNNSE